MFLYLVNRFLLAMQLITNITLGTICNLLFLTAILHVREKSVRYHLPSLLRSMPQCVIEKVHTHSLNGFSLYLKKHLLIQYNDSCSIVNCYIYMWYTCVAFKFKLNYVRV